MAKAILNDSMPQNCAYVTFSYFRCPVAFHLYRFLLLIFLEGVKETNGLILSLLKENGIFRSYICVCFRAC